MFFFYSSECFASFKLNRSLNDSNWTLSVILLLLVLFCVPFIEILISLPQADGFLECPGTKAMY